MFEYLNPIRAHQQKKVDALLIQAVEDNDFDGAKRLIEAGANVNARYEYKSTPALKRIGGVTISKFRLTPKLRKHGYTPLMTAAYRGHLDLVNHLIANKANAEDQWLLGGYTDRWTALLFAVHGNNPDVVQSLLAFGANPNHPDKDKKTALMLAATIGNAAIVHQLIAAGADVDHKDHDGNTALILGTIHGHPEIVSALLNSGADPRAKNIWSQDALSQAEYRELRDLIQSFLDRQNLRESLCNRLAAIVDGANPESALGL